MSFIAQLIDSLKPKPADDEPARIRTDYSRPLMMQLEKIRILARQEGRPEDEVAMEILKSGLERKRATNLSIHLLNELTDRELEVAALVCWGLNTAEIAGRLHITKSTARTHLSRIFVKLRVKHPAQIRDLLSWWDYSEWIR
ncbi:MAG: helix-turn-helix transcriptional regulator [Chloroflexota bacterium]